MKKIHQVFTAIIMIAFMIGSFVLGRESALHQPVTLLEVSSDGDTTEIVLPKDSLHRVECKTSYVVIK